jgi:hypothetical protein
MGKNALGIESDVAWATPGSFTVMNFPCNENGDNCLAADEYGRQSLTYEDPAIRYLQHGQVQAVPV